MSFSLRAAPKHLIAKVSKTFLPSPSLSLFLPHNTSSFPLPHCKYLNISESAYNMQPKSFIIRMARKRKTIEPEPKAVSRNRDISMSTIASRMRVSAVCENHDPLVSLEAIASQMRQGAIYDGTSRGASRATPQPAVAAWEHPESRSLSENSSLSEPPSTITSSGRSSPQDEDETPRSRKRKRQPPKLPTTPSSSTRTTPAHSPSTVATSPRSHNVARKIQSLRYVTMRPCKLRKGLL